MRYTRLNYGTNSAEDIFDKAMDDTIEALNGVFHIRDYFIVEKATQTMTRPLKLGECGLTFNPKKMHVSPSPHRIRWFHLLER